MNEINASQNPIEGVHALLDSTEKSIGKMLVDAGKLKLPDIEIIRHCQKSQGLRFGEAAVKLGLVAEADILQMLSRQFFYPYLQANEVTDLSKELVAAFDPFSPQVEALRGLRGELVLRWFNEENKQLALVGLGEGDGCSHLAANLAVVFSQLGERTILIDANLRKPRLHELFGLQQQKGLSDYLVGRVGLEEAIHKIPALVDLSVLPAGTVPPNPQELLVKPAFKLLLKDLAKHYDVTLLDTPHGLLYGDIKHIADAIGGVVVVTRKHHTRVESVRMLQEKMANIKAQLLGIVLSEF